MYTRGCQHVVLNRTKSILLHIFLLALCSVLLQVMRSVNQLTTIDRIGNVIVLLFLGLLHNVHVMLRKSMPRKDGKKKEHDGHLSVTRASVQRFRNRR